MSAPVVSPAVAVPPAPPAEAPLTLAEAAQLRFLDPAQLTFFQVGATLRLTIADECSYLQVVVLRTFPLTHPEAYYSLRDGAGKEIGVLLEPGALAPAPRALIAAAVTRRYLVPTIRRITAVVERFGTVEWSVATDRGVCQFTTRDLRDNLVTRGGQHYLLTDVEGNRFSIPDLTALDAASRERFLQHL